MYLPQINSLPGGVTSYWESLVQQPQRGRELWAGGRRKRDLSIKQRHTRAHTRTHTRTHTHFLSAGADLLILMKATGLVWPSRLPSLLVSFQQAITQGWLTLSLSDTHSPSNTHTLQWWMTCYARLVIFRYLHVEIIAAILSYRLLVLKWNYSRRMSDISFVSAGVLLHLKETFQVFTVDAYFAVFLDFCKKWISSL